MHKISPVLISLNKFYYTIENQDLTNLFKTRGSDCVGGDHVRGDFVWGDSGGVTLWGRVCSWRGELAGGEPAGGDFVGATIAGGRDDYYYYFYLFDQYKHSSYNSTGQTINGKTII